MKIWLRVKFKIDRKILNFDSAILKIAMFVFFGILNSEIFKAICHSKRLVGKIL